MKKLLSLFLLCFSAAAFAQEFNVDFDEVSWNKSGSKITQAGNEITITTSDASYESQAVSYTLNINNPEQIDDIYFTAQIYFEDAGQGPGQYDIPKMRIESTTGAKLINYNFYSIVDRQWIFTGVSLENFKNMGLSAIVLKFTYQNSVGTWKIKDAHVSAEKGEGAYAFPYDIPADPSVTLNVNTQESHRFNDDILSTNCHFTWAPKNWEDASVQEMIYKKFPMQNLRFPGGTVANFYSWEADDFYDNRFSDNNNTASSGAKNDAKFGYPGYADVTKTLGGSSTLLFNVFTDDKATSQARLQDRLDDGLNIKWIEMGNENYFGDQAYGFVDDTELGLNGNGDGEDYDEYIRHTKDLASWLREVKPDIQVAVNTHDDHWNTPLAQEDYYDACVVHNYNFINGFLLNQLTVQQFMQSYKKTENVIASHVNTFGDKPIIMSEWGLLSEMPNYFLQTLCTADNFLAIEKGAHEGAVRQAGIHMLYHGDFVGEGSLISNMGDGLKLNPVGVAYSKLFDVFMGNKVYDAYSSSTELEADLDAVHAKAIDAGDTVYIYVVNKLPVASPLNVSFDGAPFDGAYSVEAYTEDMNTTLTMNYGINENPWVKTTGNGTPSIPANSIGVVTIPKSEFQAVCMTPNLGGNTNLCAKSSVELNADVSTTNRTYSWYKDGVQLSGENTESLNVTTAGTYKVVADSAGCIRENEVVVGDELPVIYIGAYINFCKTDSKVLNAQINNPEVIYVWTKDGELLGETSGVMTAYEAGVYTVTANAGTCEPVFDEIEISSELIDVSFDTLCTEGVALLSVNESGDFAWYDQEEGGGELVADNMYEPYVDETTTFYVQNNTVENYTAGINEPTGTVYGGATDYTIWGRTMYLNVDKEFTLNTVDIFTNTAIDLVMTISGESGTFVITENGIPQTGSSTPYTLAVNQLLPIGEYTISLVGTIGKMFVQVSDKSNSIVPGILEFGGTEGDTHYGFLYNWDISVSAACARTPVLAVIDPNGSGCQVTAVEPDYAAVRVYPNPTSGVVYLSDVVDYSVSDLIGTEVLVGRSNVIDMTSLANGTYLVQVGNDVVRVVKE